MRQYLSILKINYLDLMVTFWLESICLVETPKTSNITSKMTWGVGSYQFFKFFPHTEFSEMWHDVANSFFNKKKKKNCVWLIDETTKVLKLALSEQYLLDLLKFVFFFVEVDSLWNFYAWSSYDSNSFH